MSAGMGLIGDGVVTATVDLWSWQDTVDMLPWAVAGIAVVVAAVFADRLEVVRRSRDEWHAEYEALRDRLERQQNVVLGRSTPARDPRSVREARRRHNRRPVPVTRPRRVRAAPVPLQRWMHPDPNRPHFAEHTNWPASADTAAHALELDPAPGDDTEPFPLLALEAGRG